MAVYRRKSGFERVFSRTTTNATTTTATTATHHNTPQSQSQSNYITLQQLPTTRNHQQSQSTIIITLPLHNHQQPSTTTTTTTTSRTTTASTTTTTTPSLPPSLPAPAPSLPPSLPRWIPSGHHILPSDSGERQCRLGDRPALSLHRRRLFSRSFREARSQPRVCQGQRVKSDDGCSEGLTVACRPSYGVELTHAPTDPNLHRSTARFNVAYVQGGGGVRWSREYPPSFSTGGGGSVWLGSGGRQGGTL